MKRILVFFVLGFGVSHWCDRAGTRAGSASRGGAAPASAQPAPQGEGRGGGQAAGR